MPAEPSTRAAVAEEAVFRRKAMALLEFVGIADRAHDRAQNLSYGQQRLLEIAPDLRSAPNSVAPLSPQTVLSPCVSSPSRSCRKRPKLLGERLSGKL